MTTTAKCVLESKYAENSQTTQYTAPAGTRFIIDKVTGYSPAGGALTINIVQSGGTAGASNIKAVKTVTANESHGFPEIVGHVLNPGDFISTIAAASNTVVIRISGREVT